MRSKNFVGLDVRASTTRGCVIDAATVEIVHRKLSASTPEIVACVPTLHGPRSATSQYYEAVTQTVARRDRLDKVIQQIAADSAFTPMVIRPDCLRGVSALTGLALAVEIGDWSRFTGKPSAPASVCGPVVANTAIARELAGWCWRCWP